MNLSLDDLDTSKASAEAFEFEYINAAGEPSGVFLSILGSQAEAVTREVARLVNERRRKEAQRDVARQTGVGPKKVEFETLESDVEFGQRLAAVRLVGWRGPGETNGLTEEQQARFSGITEAWSPENALRLCKGNRELAAQITTQSDLTRNFTKN